MKARGSRIDDDCHIGRFSNDRSRETQWECIIVHEAPSATAGLRHCYYRDTIKLALNASARNFGINQEALVAPYNKPR